MAKTTAAMELLSLYRKLSAKEQLEVRRALSKPLRPKPAPTKALVKRGEDPLGMTRPRGGPSEELLAYLSDVATSLSSYFPFDRYHPGEEDRPDRARAAVVRAMEPLEWLLKTYFRYEVIGIENIPASGRAMIVSNHGLLPLDGWFLAYEIARKLGRFVRGLTDFRIFRIPYLRRLFLDMGTVLGSHDNGDELLSREELLFIMPGGAKEAWKSSRYRYRLLWRGRYGFIRLAIRNQTPIIPSANVGTDDTYRVFFDGYTTAYKLFRTKRAFFPISLPVGIGLMPFPVKMTQYVGEPIYFDYPKEAAKDDDVVGECQELVKAEVYKLIDQGLREREERATEGFRSLVPKKE